jgi:hypothetical protein
LHQTDSRQGSRKPGLLVLGSILGLAIVAGLVVSTVWTPFGNRATTTATSEATVQYQDLVTVRARALEFITLLGQHNGPGAAGFFSFNVTSNWTGVSEPYSGAYSSDGPGLRLDGFLGHAVSLSETYSNLVILAAGSERISVSFGLAIREVDAVFGPINSTVNVSQSWVNFDGNWLVQSETWNFTSWHLANS